MQSFEPKSTNTEQIEKIIHDITNVMSLEAVSLARDLAAVIHDCVPYKYHHIATMLKKHSK